jgi:hypothetical protein
VIAPTGVDEKPQLGGSRQPIDCVATEWAVRHLPTCVFAFAARLGCSGGRLDRHALLAQYARSRLIATVCGGMLSA